ncbi:MAG TPA: hypothetical protein VF995_00965 [Actinomycetota bacterium]
MPRLEGMHAATATTIGWIEAGDSGSQCLFCGEPARHFQPLAATKGPLEALKHLWWCRPCETTWVA